MRDSTTALTRELFQRTRVSATVGIMGVLIMVYPHISIVPTERSLWWAVLMVLLLCARLLNSLRYVEPLPSGGQAMTLCNIEAVLCGMIGLGWGSALMVFNSDAMDALFYLRFLILACAMAFIVNSTAVFLRVSSAYTLTIGGTAIVFILTNNYIQPRGPLLFSVAFYIIMITLFAMSMNKQIRTAVADQLAVATLTEELQQSLEVERKLREELGIRADTDELTGAFNRRGVLTHLNAELARCKRSNAPLAILMMDIDHFKRINDSFGHATGDAVIRLVTNLVKSQLRETDVLGRIGGEEFLALLPGTELADALAIAERMRACVEQASLEVPGHVVRITISVGVGTRLDTDHADSLVARADLALYAAKHNGRNRVELGSPA